MLHIPKDIPSAELTFLLTLNACTVFPLVLGPKSPHNYLAETGGKMPCVMCRVRREGTDLRDDSHKEFKITTCIKIAKRAVSKMCYVTGFGSGYCTGIPCRINRCIWLLRIL